MSLKILVITPSLSGGSWISINKVLEELSEEKKFNVDIIGLGKVYQKISTYHYFSIPYLRYDRWGFITLKSPVISLLWNVPLIVLSTLFIIIKRPNIVMANGFSTILLIAPIVKILRMKLVVMYHSSYIQGYLSKTLQKIVNILSEQVDVVVVNSQGSKNELHKMIPVINEEKIIVNEHYADDYFFETKIENKRNNTCIVLFVGRLDRDKLCYPLIKIAKSMKGNRNFLFEFVGIGEYADEVKKLEAKYANVKHFSYVGDRLQLKQIYAGADVVWSYGDETYLSLPAIEALASGVPIIMPELVAIPEKAARNIKVDNDLIPKEIGWFIDPFKEHEISKLLFAIQKKGIKRNMKIQCREYAKVRYSHDNIKSTIDKIKSLV